MFADERWIVVDDPTLLDYENAQLLLIGATNETFDVGRSLQLSSEPCQVTACPGKLRPGQTGHGGVKPCSALRAPLRL